jgi:hypothetical protein
MIVDILLMVESGRRSTFLIRKNLFAPIALFFLHNLSIITLNYFLDVKISKYLVLWFI